ncbi:ATP-binding protein [Flindersiella endophytica]
MLGRVLADMLRENPHDRPDAAGARARFQALADGVPLPAGAGGPAGGAVPAQLPADVFGFTGRDTELDQLDSRPAPVVAISGTAGVGKTTLAVHWAHRIAERFPDGRLYVNLRGFDPTGQVTDPADALRGFLSALGVAPDRIPVELDAQAALYRTILSTKRVLVVLDNARDTEQVRPLLPGNPACLAIITSRNDLLGLIANQGARPITLDVLTDAEARRLLDNRLGVERTAAEPQAVDDLIAACARLPLALAIVAARAIIRPGFPLAGLTNQLETPAGADPDTDLRAVFSWSYHQLSPQAQRMFRLLGLHPGPDISTAAAASLAGSRPPLTELTRAHLVSEHAPGRYTFHDLLRTYATELTHTTDTDTDRAAATRRILDHYLHTACAADRLLSPQRDPIAPAPPAPGVAPEALEDVEQALRWYAGEQAVLPATVGLAAEAGFDTHAWQLAWAMHNYLFRQGRWPEQLAAWETALGAVRRLGDRAAEARVHRNLATTCLQLRGRLDDAHRHLTEALRLSEELGNQAGQAHTHYQLAQVCEEQRRPAEALEHAQQALALYEAIGHRSGQGIASNSVGWFLCLLGRPETALPYCERAVEIFEDLGDSYGAAGSLDSVGYARLGLGQFDAAAACFRRAIDLYDELGDPYRAADTLVHLGDTQFAAEDAAAAAESWQQALTTLHDLDHPDADAVQLKLERVRRAAPN